jgi:hypothetical protein
MIDWVHSDTLYLWEDFFESGIFVEKQTGLEDWLIVAAASSNNSDSSSTATQNGLTSARG